MAGTVRREPVTQARILDIAMRLADEGGLPALSMRRIAAELGVEAMALYNHVAGKGAILDGLVERVLADIALPEPSDSWQEGMRRRAVSARAVFRRHPWAMGLVEARPRDSSARRLGYYDAVLGSLRRAGFGSRLAMRAFSIVDAYIYGFIVQEQSLAFDDASSLADVGTDLLRQTAEDYPHLAAVTREAMAEGYEPSAEFEVGLDLILGSLERARDLDAAP